MRSVDHKCHLMNMTLHFDVFRQNACLSFLTLSIRTAIVRTQELRSSDAPSLQFTKSW